MSNTTGRGVPAIQEPILTICLDSWEAVLTLYTKQLNHGGLFVDTHTPPTIFTLVQVRLVPPEGQGVLVLPAEVVRVVSIKEAAAGKGTAGAGLQLRALSPKLDQALKELLRTARQRVGSAEFPAQGLGSKKYVPIASGPGDQAAGLNKSPEQVLKLLSEQLEWFRQKTPTQALGLSTPVDPILARKVYVSLCRKYHPDLFIRYHHEAITATVTELFALMRNAYTAALKDPSGTKRSLQRVKTSGADS